MKKWKEYKLGNILQISSGFAYKGKDIGYGNNCLLGMGCVSFKEKFLKSGVRNYNGDCPEKYCVKPNDMVLATRQQSDNLPILGMPAIIPDDLKGDKIIVGANLYKVENKSDFDSQYIYWLLKSPSYVDYIRSCQTGTTVRMITKANIESYSFLAPNKKCRDRIVSILSSLDDKIEVNRRINEQLEELAQALFKSWFVDFEPFKDGEFVESELGMIPEGCTTISLSKMANYLNGLAMQKFRPLEDEKGLPVLKIKELGQDACNETSELCSPSLVNEKYIVNDGDIIFSWSGTLLVKIWCGGACGLNQHLFKVTSDVFPKWYVYLWTKYHLDKFIRIAKDKAVTMGHIKRGELDSSYAIVLDKEKMRVIDGLMTPIIDQIISNNVENRNLTNLRDTLLPKLMSGEIDVNDVEI